MCCDQTYGSGGQVHVDGMCCTHHSSSPVWVHCSLVTHWVCPVWWGSSPKSQQHPDPSPTKKSYVKFNTIIFLNEICMNSINMTTLLNPNVLIRAHDRTFPWIKMFFSRAESRRIRVISKPATGLSDKNSPVSLHSLSVSVLSFFAAVPFPQSAIFHQLNQPIRFYCFENTEIRQTAHVWPSASWLASLGESGL